MADGQRNRDSALMAFIKDPLGQMFTYCYLMVQAAINWIFAPGPPQLGGDAADNLPRRRIAIIGAGLTGVSSAAHCISHDLEVEIFESRDQAHGLGGIWSRVNSTSSLQIHSIMYRFHPSVHYNNAYPTQQEVRDQIVQLWQRYNLAGHTHFQTPVTSVAKDRQGKWVINNDATTYGVFDGVIAAVGTCGEPKMAPLPDDNKFGGQILHSSNLDGKDVNGKRVLIVGGGASAIEALEFAVQGKASQIDVLSRSDKWIIPRNIFVQSLLALNIFGQETAFTWIPEWLLQKFFYRDLQHLAPSGGLFKTTPMANNDLLEQIRQGKARWLRGDIISATRTGILFSRRGQDVPEGGPGHEKEVPGDVIIMATGFRRPSLSFLPDDAFEEPYTPPSWYLQVFPPRYPTICASNSTFVNAIGTVGNMHIGIYARFLLMFVTDPLTRPTENRMKTWIDFTRFMKKRAPTPAFDFFTYSELLYWFVFCILVNPFRWKWAPFVLFGVGWGLPLAIVRPEEALRDELNEQE